MHRLMQHRDTMDKESDHSCTPKLVIIAGCTPFGIELAHQLYSADYAVIVIDPDQSALDQLGERFGGISYKGEATNPAILEQCRVADASHLIAVFNDDAVNILIGKMADTVFHVPDVKILLGNGGNRISIAGSAIKTICAPEILAQKIMLDLKSEGVQIAQDACE